MDNNEGDEETTCHGPGAHDRSTSPHPVSNLVHTMENLMLDDPSLIPYVAFSLSSLLRLRSRDRGECVSSTGFSSYQGCGA